MAFFSGGDLADEKASRLFGVIGKLSSASPEMVVRAASNKQEVKLKIEDIFDASVVSLKEDSDYSVPEGSLDKITEIYSQGKVTPSVGNLYTFPNTGYAGIYEDFDYYTDRPSRKQPQTRYNQTLNAYASVYALDSAHKFMLEDLTKALRNLFPSPYVSQTTKNDSETIFKTIRESFSSLIDSVFYNYNLDEHQIDSLTSEILCDIEQANSYYNGTSSTTNSETTETPLILLPNASTNDLLLNNNSIDAIPSDFYLVDN
jgi:hypothetical protein